MDVKISKPSRQCTKCGHDYADGEVLTTALIERSDGSFERHDICNRCWPSVDAKTLHCFWTNEFSAKQKPALMDTDTLWQVFHSARARLANEPDVQPFVYVAALGLVRLRQLTMEDSTRDADGIEIMTLRTKGKKREDFHVAVPVLRASDVVGIEERISEFAEGATDRDEDADESEEVSADVA